MNYEKLSARMAALLAEYQTSGLAPTSGPRAIPLASDNPAAPPAVFAYLRCDENANFDHVAGVAVHNQHGRVRTALVSLDSVDELSEQNDLYRIAPAVQLKPLNDVAAVKTNLPAFKTSSGLTGQGVIVGVVDSGIDANHPAFAGRILSIWDQTITGTGWGNTNYGTVLSGATLGVSADINGHGTHVAGTAAGNDVQFGGVAPGADLIVVKTNFLNAGIGDGIRYVFAEAARLGRPAVVNLSLGGHFDAHDGSDDLSEMINQEAGAGRLVIAAAGNEGDSHIHADATIAPGQTASIRFNVPPGSLPGATPWVLLNGWYGPGEALEISVRTSTGSTTPFQPVITSGPTAQVYNSNSARIRIATPTTTATPNGDHQFLVEIRPGLFSPTVQGGAWRLRLRNTGTSAARVHVWSLVPSNANDAEFAAPFDSDTMKIGSPGSAAEAVTVAAYTTRNSWTDAAGAPRSVGLLENRLADFSSPGPLRDGAQKPDVAAPGAMIISCRSAQSNPRPSNIINARFRINAGTSMACPYIAGLAALLLERDPTLTPAALKTLLQTHSRIPNQPAGAFDPLWGFGLIDAGSL